MPKKSALARVPAKGGQALASARELAAVWGRWLDEPAARAERGRRAAEVVQREVGAAERSATIVSELMAS